MQDSTSDEAHKVMEALNLDPRVHEGLDSKSE